MTVTFDSVMDQLQSGEIVTGLYGSTQSVWLKYCYHFSHVENIVSILKDGKLLSRHKALKMGKMIMRVKKS